ncbi:hypothetical protein H5410_001525 [Solanum commersonii]|uniref:Uncharacterized protein n=1 Tax=Solanum commersonii TaxID=4109 RepID=A0A9J6AZB1_SOLCO|nr:hypothetical protein H5410_001525 [Solanum commersonii]
MSYEHGENEFYEAYDGPYEHGNGDLVYDYDSYEGYDGPWDNEQHGGENYYSRDDFEMNGTFDSYDDVEGVEGPYGVYHCDNEGSRALHHGYDGDMRYNSFSHMSYESFEQNLEGNESCEVGGREGGTLSYEVVELRESLTTLREDFDDFLLMFEKLFENLCSILGRKPSEAPQNVKNHEVLESFQKEQMCSNVDNQSADTSSYELQGNNANSYTSLTLEHHCVASSPLGVNYNLSICYHSESLPSDVLDSTLFEAAPARPLETATSLFLSPLSFPPIFHRSSPFLLLAFAVATPPTKTTRQQLQLLYSSDHKAIAKKQQQPGIAPLLQRFAPTAASALLSGKEIDNANNN